jgi:hypothetical protein
MLRNEFGPIRGYPDRAKELRQGNRAEGVWGAVPRSIPKLAKLAWVHFPRRCPFAYSGYASV